MEKIILRPGVSAIHSYKDRDITDNGNTVFIGIFFNISPLAEESELQEFMVLDLVREFCGCCFKGEILAVF